jgi:hypothetical protein
VFKISHNPAADLLYHVMIEYLFELLSQILSCCVDAFFKVSVLVGERISLISKQYLTDLLGQETHFSVIIVCHYAHMWQ